MSGRPAASVGLPRRLLLGGLLAIGGAFLAFVAGTAFAARFLVPPGTGLAGPAEAVGYGLLGAAGAVLLAVLIAIFAGRPLLLVATLIVVPLALASAAGLAFLAQQSAAPEAELPMPARATTAPGAATGAAQPR
jgi:hypothetical protein